MCCCVYFLQVSIDQSVPATTDGNTLINTGQSADRGNAQNLGSSQNVADPGYVTAGTAEGGWEEHSSTKLQFCSVHSPFWCWGMGT